MHEKSQGRIFSTVYYEDRGEYELYLRILRKKTWQDFVTVCNFCLRRITGIYAYHLIKCKYNSKILVILVIRGDFVSVCNFVSGVLKCPQKVGQVKHYPVWLISLYFTGLIPFNLDLILLLL